MRSENVSPSQLSADQVSGDRETRRERGPLDVVRGKMVPEAMSGESASTDPDHGHDQRRMPSGRVSPVSTSPELGAPRLRDRFEIIDEDAVEDLPDQDFLIEGVLLQGSLTVLYGSTNTYKSFVAHSMAGSIATGLDWQGVAVEQGHVVYVVAEGTGDLGRRHSAFKEAHDLETLGNISHVPEPINLFTAGRDFGESDALVSQVRHLEPSLIVIDTLARCMAGGDESFAKDIHAVISSADRMRTVTGAAVLIIRHSGHDTRRERGSSALKAAADTFIKQTSKDLTATLVCQKMKSAAAFEPITIQLGQVAESLSVLPEPVPTAPSESALACATLVPAHGINHGDWKQAFIDAGFGSARTFERRRTDLIALGLVRKTDSDSGPLYRLTAVRADALGASSANPMPTPR